MTTDYEDMPDEFRKYITDGIETAEAELQDSNADTLPGGGLDPGDHIPPELIEAVMWQESRFNPSAVNTQGYCNDYGGRATGLGQFCLNPGGNPSGSLELSDYTAVTGKQVTQGDILQPDKDIHLIAFGLGDRYSRLKPVLKTKKPKNWFLSVVGYSPAGAVRPDGGVTDPSAYAYMDDLYNYVAAKYGEDRALDIQQNAGGNTSSDRCNKYKWFDPRYINCKSEGLDTSAEGCDKWPKWNPSYWTCKVSGAGQKEHDKVVKQYTEQLIIYGIAGVAVFLGFMLLAKGPAQFVKNNPEVLAL